LAHGIPLIIAESPIKGIACDQTGIRAIGINGVWGACVENDCGFYVIRADLQKALDWRGRQVYLAFDADWLFKPEVRQALIRTFLVLSAQGAQVLLLSWDPDQGKGIDDFLTNQTKSNGISAAEVLKDLVAGAKRFIDVIDPSALNLALVQTEFGRVLIPSLLRDQLIKQLAPRWTCAPRHCVKLVAIPRRPGPSSLSPPITSRGRTMSTRKDSLARLCSASTKR